MTSPVGALIGVGAIGAGVVMLYGAYANVSVFGKDGILSTALSTGTIPDVSKLPKKFPSLVADVPHIIGMDYPVYVQNAVRDISAKDPALGTQLHDALVGLNSDSTAADVSALNAMLISAEGQGFRDQATQIRGYITSVVSPNLALLSEGP